MILEVCCENIESVKAAIAGGADRIELCRDLAADGLTPSREMTGEAVRLCRPAGVQVHVLIRLRAGNFVYTSEEIEGMAAEIRMALEEGADGVVIGALNDDGDIDLAACQTMLQGLRLDDGNLRCNVTFHRAFDVCRRPFEAMEQIARLGCNRILTSGQQPTAEQGIALLKQLVENAHELSQRTGKPFAILCGAGVTPENAAHILTATGAGEIHGSLRTGLVTDARKVKQVKHAF